MTEKQIRDSIAELTRAGANVNVDLVYASILGQIARSKLPAEAREELEALATSQRDQAIRLSDNRIAQAEQALAQAQAQAPTAAAISPEDLQAELDRKRDQLLQRQPTREPDVAGVDVSAEDFSGIPSLPVDTSDDASRLDIPVKETGRRSPADIALEEAIEASKETTTSSTSGGSTTAADAATRDANQAEVERLLAEQFGGFAFFLQKHRSDLQVGLTADGQVVASDDPNAATVKNILDVIVDQGITAPTRVAGMIKNTEWWKKTDAKMREYDVLTADMSEPQKTEYLEPVLDMLREEAKFLGIELDSSVARRLAEDITRMGEENDTDYVRGVLTYETKFNAAESVASGFAAERDSIVALSKRYFTPIDDAAAATYAQSIYEGTLTKQGVEQMFREQAAATYPPLENALNAGITPEQYFAPYKYEIERMLDRPNVDLYEEFGDVVQFIPDTGTNEARPMTLGEVRKYVRGLDEWQQSSSGKESARSLSFSIGKLFGEVA